MAFYGLSKVITRYNQIGTRLIQIVNRDNNFADSRTNKLLDLYDLILKVRLATYLCMAEGKVCIEVFGSNA